MILSMAQHFLVPKGFLHSIYFILTLSFELSQASQYCFLQFRMEHIQLSDLPSSKQCHLISCVSPTIYTMLSVLGKSQGLRQFINWILYIISFIHSFITNDHSISSRHKTGAKLRVVNKTGKLHALLNCIIQLRDIH